MRFTEYIGRKEQVEGGKSGERSQNGVGSVEKDRNLEYMHNDFPPRQHSPVIDHYQN
jgi:hypothetical protein